MSECPERGILKTAEKPWDLGHIATSTGIPYSLAAKLMDELQRNGVISFIDGAWCSRRMMREKASDVQAEKPPPSSSISESFSTSNLKAGEVCALGEDNLQDAQTNASPPSFKTFRKIFERVTGHLPSKARQNHELYEAACDVLGEDEVLRRLERWGPMRGGPGKLRDDTWAARNFFNDVYDLEAREAPNNGRPLSKAEERSARTAEALNAVFGSSEAVAGDRGGTLSPTNDSTRHPRLLPGSK